MTAEERNLLIQMAVALDTLLAFAIPIDNGRVSDVRAKLREATAVLQTRTTHEAQ